MSVGNEDHVVTEATGPPHLADDVSVHGAVYDEFGDTAGTYVVGERDCSTELGSPPVVGDLGQLLEQELVVRPVDIGTGTLRDTAPSR